MTDKALRAEVLARRDALARETFALSALLPEDDATPGLPHDDLDRVRWIRAARRTYGPAPLRDRIRQGIEEPRPGAWRPRPRRGPDDPVPA